MLRGSIFTSSDKGSNKRRAMDTAPRKETLGFCFFSELKQEVMFVGAIYVLLGGLIWVLCMLLLWRCKKEGGNVNNNGKFDKGGLVIKKERNTL